MTLTKVTYSMLNGAPVNVLDYGAVGDGIADDTASLQAAVAAVIDAGGGTVYFPTGIYLTDAITIQSNVSLIGDGRSSILKGKTGQHVIDTPGGGFDNVVQGVKISQLKIDGAGLNGLNLINMQRLIMDHVYVTNCGNYGMYLKWSYVCKFDTVEFDQNNAGSVGTVIDSCNVNTFINCLWFDCLNAAVQIYTTENAPSSQNNFIGCDFENNHDVDVYINGGSSNLFLGCWSESSNTPEACIKIADDTSTFEQIKNRIENCFFSGTNYTNIIVLDYLSSVTEIVGNTFGPSTGNNILINSSAVKDTFLARNWGPNNGPPTVTDGSVSTTYFLNSDQSSILSGPAFLFNTEGGATMANFNGAAALTSGQTHLLLRYHTGTGVSFERVGVGAPNSGGTGYRALTVPN